MGNVEEFTLAVGPKKFMNTIYKKMDIDDLHFYPDNPRISSITLKYDCKDLTDELIYSLMETEQSEATKSLYQDVKRDGQINEPLIVHNNRVLEGNTRLWVARTLFNDTKSPQWKLVQCRVVQGDLGTREIDYILCNSHIRKKKDWNPFEQACYFYRMYSQENRSFKEIAELTSVGQNTIKDYIMTFKEMKARNADKDKWSYYYETIKDREVKKAERKGIPVVDIMERELKKGDIKDAKHVRKFKKILKDEVATKKLARGEIDLYRAEKIAVTRNPEQDDEFLRSLVEIKDMLENADREKIISLKNNPRKMKIVTDFLDSVKEFSKFINN